MTGHGGAPFLFSFCGDARASPAPHTPWATSFHYACWRTRLDKKKAPLLGPFLFWFLSWMVPFLFWFLSCKDVVSVKTSEPEIQGFIDEATFILFSLQVLNQLIIKSESYHLL